MEFRKNSFSTIVKVAQQLVSQMPPTQHCCFLVMKKAESIPMSVLGVQRDSSPLCWAHMNGVGHIQWSTILLVAREASKISESKEEYICNFLLNNNNNDNVLLFS